MFPLSGRGEAPINPPSYKPCGLGEVAEDTEDES